MPDLLFTEDEQAVVRLLVRDIRGRKVTPPPWNLRQLESAVMLSCPKSLEALSQLQASILPKLRAMWLVEPEGGFDAGWTGWGSHAVTRCEVGYLTSAPAPTDGEAQKG